MTTADEELAREVRGPAVVTQLLNEASAGSPQAATELLPLVYGELRALAARRMRQERPDHTLVATALVHEAYLRLVGGAADAAQVRWQGRWHFFAAAAQAMRRILVENARGKERLKRGGGGRRVDLDDVAALTLDEPPDGLLALDEALAEFARERSEEAQLVQLRYFAGLTRDQAAEALGISPATATRDWAYARAWLYQRITRDGRPDDR